jgi:hypothetical protein
MGHSRLLGARTSRFVGTSGQYPTVCEGVSIVCSKSRLSYNCSQRKVPLDAAA